MSNQIVISSGAKVRSLEGVLTGTAGIVNSVPLGGANGVATLDALGKVPLSQLPASVVTYLGTWNAATNTPTLTNGVGDVGDLYICNVAGTVNFGAGPITFAVGDWVIYNGSQWQKSAGASGTVTSVAVTESGDALTITGSPITTSGTINIGFAGTGSQYIKGDGTLATFPTTIDQAKRLITEVYNSTGATLTKGTVVYINGGQGNLPTVTKAQANNDANSAQTYGVVQDDITNMNNGFVVVLGSLTDLDTSAYVVGTQLYLSGTTAGAWTSTKPSAPIHLVYVAIVVRSHPTQGVVEVRIQNGYELEEIHDVAISAPVNNQGIFYNSSNDLWENKSIATALGYTPANDALVVHLAGTETITGAKTFDAGLSLKDAVYPTPLSGYSSIGANPFGISIVTNQSSTIYRSDLGFPAAQRTYTFPNADGTIALTSNLSSYVPYTGATGNVNLGTNNLTASNLFGETSLNVKILGSGSIYSTGYSTFSTLAGKLTLAQEATAGNLKAFTFDFSAWSTNTSYTYTLPAINGTLALLEGSQTFTGAKTFSLATNNESGIRLKNGFGASATGYTGLGADADQLWVSVTAATHIFNFPSTTSRTYTFPAATGTIALISDLSSYVTLSTTQTISGQKTFSGGVLIDTGSILIKNGINATTAGYTGFGVSASGTTDSFRLYFGSGQNSGFNFTNTGTYTYTFPASNGTIALTSNLSAYLPLTGGTLTGALNGTDISLQSTNFDILKWQKTSGTASNVYSLSADASGCYIQDVTNTKTLLYLAENTGAATFSSSVMAGDQIKVSGSGAYLSIYDTQASSKNWAIRAGHDAVGDLAIRQSNSTGGDPVSAGTTRLYISNSGNIGIGTIIPTAKLTVFRTGSSFTTLGQSRYLDINDDWAAANARMEIGLGFTSTGTATNIPSVIGYLQTSTSGYTYGDIYFATRSVTTDTAPTERMRISSGGTVTIQTPTSGVGLFVYGKSSEWTSQFQGINSSGVSFGVKIIAGTNSSDAALLIKNAADNSDYLRVRGDGYISSVPTYNNTYSLAANMYIGSDGFMGRSTSSLKYKTDVVNYDKGLLDVMKMRPVYYKSKNEKEAGMQFAGLIAEEIHDLGLKEFVQYAEDGSPDALAYTHMVALLIKAIQEQQAQIEELKAMIES